MKKKFNSLKDITSEMVSSIQQYTFDIQNKIKNEVINTGNKILAEIKEKVPISKNNKNHLRNYFILEIKENEDEIIAYIRAKKKYQIVHLIEFGVKHYWSGTQIIARPFMRPAYNNNINEFIENIKNIIKNGV